MQVAEKDLHLSIHNLFFKCTVKVAILICELFIVGMSVNIFYSVVKIKSTKGLFYLWTFHEFSVTKLEEF